MITKTIKLDINKKLYEPIKAKQGDTKSRFILFNLYDGAMQFDLTNRTVRVYCKKKDNKVVFNDLVINDAKKGYCTLELTNQVLAVEGKNELELVIFEDEKRLSTMPFVLDVIASNYNEDAIASVDEFKALLNALKTVEEFKEHIRNCSGSSLPPNSDDIASLLSRKLDRFDDRATVTDSIDGKIEYKYTTPMGLKAVVDSVFEAKLRTYNLRDFAFEDEETLIAEIFKDEIYYSNKELNLNGIIISKTPIMASEKIEIKAGQCIGIEDAILFVK